MITASIVVGIVFCAMVAGTVVQWRRDSYATPAGLMLVASLLTFMGFAVVLGVTVAREYDLSHGPGKCAAYGRDTDRQVRWIQVSYWDYGCYVLTEDGWVPKDQIVKVERSPG